MSDITSTETAQGFQATFGSFHNRYCSGILSLFLFDNHIFCDTRSTYLFDTYVNDKYSLKFGCRFVSTLTSYGYVNNSICKDWQI